MTKAIKCGEYMIKDGIPFYRPGKRFVVVDMPQKMEIQYSDPVYGVYFSPDDIAQMNCLLNYRWKRQQIKRHRQMEWMFAKKVLSREFQRPVVCAKQAVVGLVKKFQIAAALRNRTRDD